LILDAVARRYSVMPSGVMKLGDSLDMRCANLGLAYEIYLNKKGKEGTKLDNVVDHGYSTEQLQQMVSNVKGKHE
jgi:hypothetical protein